MASWVPNNNLGAVLDCRPDTLPCPYNHHCHLQQLLSLCGVSVTQAQTHKSSLAVTNDSESVAAPVPHYTRDLWNAICYWRRPFPPPDADSRRTMTTTCVLSIKQPLIQTLCSSYSSLVCLLCCCGLLEEQNSFMLFLHCFKSADSSANLQTCDREYGIWKFRVSSSGAGGLLLFLSLPWGLCLHKWKGMTTQQQLKSHTPTNSIWVFVAQPLHSRCCPQERQRGQRLK